MRFILAILVVMTTCRTLDAAPEPLEVAEAEMWVKAMHDHDFAAAAATTALPLTLDDASVGRDAASLATADAIAKAFGEMAKGEHSVFRHPRWKTAESIEVVSAKAARAKVAKDDRVVRVTIREATSDTSWRIITYVLAEKPMHTGFAIELIETGPMAIAN